MRGKIATGRPPKNDNVAGKRGPGRPKGSVNRITKTLREMILEALDGAGGVEYLKEQARDNPDQFLALLGKIIPLQVSGESGGPIRIEATWLGSSE